MENTYLKNIEFSILAMVKRGNSITRAMVYLEIKRKYKVDDLSEDEFNEKWNHLVNNKCLLLMDESEPEKGVQINPLKNCLIIYGLIEYQNEHKKKLLK